MELEEHEKKPFMLAALVVVLSIVAIVAFFAFGGGLLFYAIAIIAIVIGAYLALHISNEAKANQANVAKKNRRKTG